MKSKNNQHERRSAQPSLGGRPPQLAPSMVEDKFTEELKKRAQDLGLIVNAGADKAAKPTSKKKGGKR